MEKVEKDAINVLKFMASNGLVANSKMTSLITLNKKLTKDRVTINIGKEQNVYPCFREIYNIHSFIKFIHSFIQRTSLVN